MLLKETLFKKYFADNIFEHFLIENLFEKDFFSSKYK